jgi:alkylated DNA repair dioxygenase AlkB
MYDGFTEKQLDDHHTIFCGALPRRLLPNQTEFEILWNLHPKEFHEIRMLGKLVKTPRWQQAYGKDYHYTQQTNVALSIPDELQPFFDWVRTAIDERLNGILLNWYDGRLGHYIGKHRDSTTNMIKGAPIVTISLGEERVFRLRPLKEKVIVDFPAENSTVFIMPYDTNLAWTHEVPRSARHQGRRISVTLRAFE